MSNVASMRCTVPTVRIVIGPTIRSMRVTGIADSLRPARGSQSHSRPTNATRVLGGDECQGLGEPVRVGRRSHEGDLDLPL